MEIKAKVSLSLPNEFYKIILKYDTFESATYDSYLIASLVKNAKSEEEALTYIDEITGKGSLNPHFKKLFKEISKFSKEQIEGILKDSLFPITVIDRKHHFKYYEMFDATRMDDKVYQGNLAKNSDLSNMIMPKNKDAKFLSMEFEQEAGSVKSNVYDAIFSEDGIKVDLDGGTYCPISKEDFEKVYSNDLESIESYPGKVGKEITKGNWNVLNNSALLALNNLKLFFIDDEGNHCAILTDCLKKTEVINVFGLYFYKETRYEYSSKNADICEAVIDYLLKSKAINEFKTKSLIAIAAAASDKSAQKVVQYILGRKESKEIAEIGLSLIKSGLEKGWEKEVLRSIKKITPRSEIQCIYKLDNSLGYEIEDLLVIDDIELTEADKMTKRAYTSQMENLKKECNQMIGEIMTSGVREKMKSLKTKDSVYKALNNFIKEYSAHSKLDYDSMSLEKLTNVYNKIKSVYTGCYEKIKSRLEKEEEKA